jgi:protein-S-isoprenylcysteine O-methyltransferase Ste14
MRRARLRSAALLLFQAACLLIPARRIGWPMAWAVLGFFAAFSLAGLHLLRPDLIAERSRIPADAERLDLLVAGLALFFLYPATLVVCGLEARDGVADVPSSLAAAAFAIFAAGYALSLWAATVNPFFSAAVRIQRERGHHVIDRGPYAWVRHPGYAGPVASHLALPLALGSWRGLAPAVLGCLLLALRAVYEERRLVHELPGYADYAARVRYRLVPGLW